MGDITYAALVAGTIPTADAVARRIYEPKVSGSATSLAVINGLLDTDNFKAGDNIESHQLQRRAFAQAWTVGQTAPFDYPRILFSQDGRGARDSDYIDIPGGCVSRHVTAEQALVKVSWQISVSSGIEEDIAGDQTLLQVWLDDTIITAFELPSAIFDPGNLFTSVDEPWVVENAPGLSVSREHYPVNDRVYSGSFLASGVTRGWHTARIAIHSEAKLTRVRTRSIRLRWDAEQ
jgi:hypothetical protein